MSLSAQSSPQRDGSPPSSQPSSPWIRKPLSVVHQQESSLSLSALNNNNSDNNTDNSELQQLHRHLSVWDLIGIGVGGTVGSGIFVLTGQIASQYSGRATWVSLGLAGVAACLSGTCYAELSARIPAAGSTYVYAYVCLGEAAAVLAAACLTLEYGVAGAAVARTWGDKVLLLLLNMDNDTDLSSSSSSWLTTVLRAGGTGGAVNVPAFLVSAACTLLLLSGVQESKRVMNWITLLKMGIVAFMIVGGYVLYSPSRIRAQPFAPHGAAGVLRGATTSFFGYLGYDEVCCVAGEAKHPARDMPRAVLGTLLTVTVCYILAATALTGMLSYTDISPTAGFPDAFDARGHAWAAQLTAVGEVVTLPVVVLISLMAQPRLTLSMAVDGLLPKIFASVDASTGNLRGGTLVSGICMTIVATFVPFTYLDDLISAGILVAFSMTNTCLVLLRCESSSSSPMHTSSSLLLEQLLAAYNTLCFLTAMLWSHTWIYLPFQTFWAVAATTASVACLAAMTIYCPKTKHFGGTILREGEYTSERHVTHEETQSSAHNGEGADGDDTTTTPTLAVVYFETPMIPILPCTGMAVNWFLIAQLDVTGILLLCLYLGLAAAVYWLGCARHSVGQLRNWNVHNNRGNYQTVDNHSSATTSGGAAAAAANSNNGEDYFYGDGESELRPIPPGDGLFRTKAPLARTNSL